MTSPAARLLLAGFVLALPLFALRAQDPPRGDDDYKRLYKTPERPIEFYNAVQYELDQGSYALAGKWLRALVAKKAPDKDLLEIVDKEGTIAVLRLRNVRNWTADRNVEGYTVKDAEAKLAKAKADKEDDKAQKAAAAFVTDVALNVATRKDAETLIESLQAAVRRRAGDAAYIGRLIGQLRAEPEEKAFAVRELYKLGPTVVPYILADLEKSKDAGERLVLRQALDRLGPQALPPLVAGLDGYSAPTRLEILDLLRTQYASAADRTAPFLLFPSANPAESAVVRKKAKSVLADFTSTPPDRLPPAKQALVREAERYARGEVTYLEPPPPPGKTERPASVTVWRWDEKAKVVVRGADLTAAQARQYYGRRFARQALELDPEYLPAQVLFLSMALEDAAEKKDGDPALAEQLNKAKLDLLLATLDRALKEERPNVAVPILKVIGDRKEVRAKRPLTKGEPGLVRALNYKGADSKRVQTAAAQALLAIPGAPAPGTQKRILEILGHSLTPAASPVAGRKILVAIGDAVWRDKARRSVNELGAKPVEASNGKDAVRLLRTGADIDAVLLDSTLTPGVAHLLAQLRADADVAKVPVFVAAVPETAAALASASRYRDLLLQKDSLDAELRDYRGRVADLNAKEDAAKRELSTSSLSRSQVSDEFVKIEKNFGGQRREAERLYPGVLSTLRRADENGRALAEEAKRYDLEAQLREASLSRFAGRFAGVTVVPTSAFNSAEALGPLLRTASEAAALPTTAEQAEQAEGAMRTLLGLTLGKPAGYDVQPLTGVILDALREGRLKDDGQTAAVEIASRLPGARPQLELSNVVLAAKRPLPVRQAAAAGLLVHRQRYGNLLPAAAAAAVRAEAARDGQDAGLKERLDRWDGSLAAERRATGERLREYEPTAGGPPPKKMKEEE